MVFLSEKASVLVRTRHYFLIKHTLFEAEGKAFVGAFFFHLFSFLIDGLLF